MICSCCWGSALGLLFAVQNIELSGRHRSYSSWPTGSVRQTFCPDKQRYEKCEAPAYGHPQSIRETEQVNADAFEKSADGQEHRATSAYNVLEVFHGSGQEVVQLLHQLTRQLKDRYTCSCLTIDRKKLRINMDVSAFIQVSICFKF